MNLGRTNVKKINITSSEIDTILSKIKIFNEDVYNHVREIVTSGHNQMTHQYLIGLVEVLKAANIINEDEALIIMGGSFINLEPPLYDDLANQETINLNISDYCLNCPNNPKNGGDGICHCVLGSLS